MWEESCVSIAEGGRSAESFSPPPAERSVPSLAVVQCSVGDVLAATHEVVWCDASAATHEVVWCSLLRRPPRDADDRLGIGAPTDRSKWRKVEEKLGGKGSVTET